MVERVWPQDGQIRRRCGLPQMGCNGRSWKVGWVSPQKTENRPGGVRSWVSRQVEAQAPQHWAQRGNPKISL